MQHWAGKKTFAASVIMAHEDSSSGFASEVWYASTEQGIMFTDTLLRN